MDIDELIEAIVDRRARVKGRAVLIGLSGIDASGKGYIADMLRFRLERSGHRTALINVDGWLNLPPVRFLSSPNQPRDGSPFARRSETGATPEGTHFYEHGLRLDEMFATLVLPLKQNRSVELTIDFVEETATAYRPHTYRFSEIDIVLLEGIFIFKRAYIEHFDLRVWVESSFATAMKRAIARGQEDLAPDQTIAAYETIYFPAQRIHFAIDNPKSAVDIVLPNESDNASSNR